MLCGRHGVPAAASWWVVAVSLLCFVGASPRFLCCLNKGQQKGKLIEDAGKVVEVTYCKWDERGRESCWYMMWKVGELLFFFSKWQHEGSQTAWRRWKNFKRKEKDAGFSSRSSGRKELRYTDVLFFFLFAIELITLKWVSVWHESNCHVVCLCPSGGGHHHPQLWDHVYDPRFPSQSRLPAPDHSRPGENSSSLLIGKNWPSSKV